MSLKNANGYIKILSITVPLHWLPLASMHWIFCRACKIINEMIWIDMKAICCYIRLIYKIITEMFYTKKVAQNWWHLHIIYFVKCTSCLSAFTRDIKITKGKPNRKVFNHWWKKVTKWDRMITLEKVPELWLSDQESGLPGCYTPNLRRQKRQVDYSGFIGAEGMGGHSGVLV